MENELLGDYDFTGAVSDVEELVAESGEEMGDESGEEELEDDESEGEIDVEDEYLKLFVKRNSREMLFNLVNRTGQLLLNVSRDSEIF